ncbi:DUF4350 domain-containing protein [Streptomyces sp. ID05-04B]|uniref:DUF4350 domain-containing protein n=1 Tax=unclassified Streptomyces TaxID=2593676 RepID=UPI000D1AB683|nr:MULTISPECIES: DUF4350 domain-containing protein [unclassified Streptomyces]AVV42309.1 DUF4350 domain-containing protein [Streptomyces sp. P3]MDX5570647.1 DUF4350 domain-containing protein [Streptomyces sp. ID05-04B]
MTTEATLPTTSAPPTALRLWTRARGPVLAFALLLAAAITLAALQSDARHGALDPRSADPYGSRAIAELLADRGVTTRVVTDLADARAAADPDTTLLVAAPDLLTERQQKELHTATAGSGGRTVLVAPGSWSVGTLAPGVTADPANSHDSVLSPDCTLPAARRAGTADTGGIRYTTHRPDAEECYPSERLATLLRLPDTTGDGDTLVLGAPDILYNNRLDQQGNASLALQLLGSRKHLVWYLPSLADATATDPDDEKSFVDLLPSGWLWGTLQLFVAAGLAALWRARRLGPLVAEKLPVSIRASETVEGRARLYRKADARDRAAAALRSTTRTRLAPLLGVPVPQAHTPEALVPALTAHLHGNGQALHSLLFGPPPGDDAALISLADQLDALEREVRRP